MDRRTKSTLPSIDYQSLFDRQVAQTYFSVEPEPTGTYYPDERGMVVRTAIEGAPYFHDLIRFAPDAMAFTSAGAPAPARVARDRQIIGDGDWIHFCLRLGAAGSEDISDFGEVDQPSRACMITRYPAGTEINRAARQNDAWRVACLWLKPKALVRYLETSPSHVPNGLSWLVDEKLDAARHLSIPLTARMHLAVNDVLSCQFTGGTRRAFIFSKYLELLTTIYQSLLERSQASDVQPSKLSSNDLKKIADVESILTSRIENMDSLAVLAKRVGVNRTKLVLGFRAVYGTSVEAYWRDWRLQKARDLLCDSELSVNEVAYQVGYSEISAFTRAFRRKFGVPPKHGRVSR